MMTRDKDEKGSNAAVPSFPFGHEDIYSRESLKVALCNHINLGQWELAYASLTRLLSCENLSEKERQELADFISHIIRGPQLYCTGNGNIKSPAHLSWLAYLALEENFKSEFEKLPSWVKPVLEFRLLLHELSDDEDTPFCQEIDAMYMASFSSASDNTSQSQSCELTQSMQTSLTRILAKNQVKCRALTDEILKRMPYEPLKVQIKKLYFGFVRNLISTLEQKANDQLCEETDSKILLNALVNLVPYADAEDDYDIYIIKCLSRLILDNSNSFSLGIRQLLAASIDVNKRDLLKILGNLEGELIMKRLGLDPKFSGSDIQILIDSTTQLSKMPVSNVISKSLKENSASSWRDLFWICDIYQIDFMEFLMKSSLDHIRNGNLDDAMDLLSPDLCSPLNALILLVIWPECKSYTDAQDLLAILWKNKGGCAEPVLDQACQKLEYQLKIVTWCLEKARSVLGSSVEGSHQSVLKMFHRVDSHSVLYVLNKAHLLQSLPYSEVVGLLHEQPITFQLEQSKAAAELRKVQNEIAFYNCFYSVKEFLKILVNCKLKEDKDEGRLNRGTDVEHFDASTALANLQDIVNKINSLNLRLELLENLFSLLFIQGTDVFEMQQDDCDEDNLEGLTHSILSSRSVSLESFSTVDTTDPHAKEDTLTKGEDVSGSSGSHDRAILSPSRQERAHTFDSDSCEILENADALDTTDAVEMYLQDSSCQGEYSSSETLKNDRKGTDASGSFTDLGSTLVAGLDISISDIGPGFIVGENAMMRSLEFLQNCLSQLAKESAEAPPINDASVSCSITKDQFEQRLSLLNQHANEGVWRLHLISGADDYNDAVNNDTNATFHSEEGDNMYGKEPPISPRNDPKASLSNGIVPRMLSSKESLVYLCLNKNNIIQADQVIRMFSLDDSNCALEASFIKEIKSIFSELREMSSQKDAPSSKAPSPLSSIRSAAAAGRVSTDVLSRLDQLLMHPFVKTLNDIKIEDDEQGYWKSTYLNQCALLMDLLVSDSLSQSVAKTVTDLSDAKLNEATEWYQISRMDAASPVFSFLLKCKGLLGLFSQISDVANIHNICQVFLTSQCSSAPDTVKTHFENLRRQEKSHGILQECLGRIPEDLELEKEITVEGGTIRQAMTELASALGLENVCSSFKLSSGHDYVKCLFKHVDTLATLQLVYKTRHFESQEKSKRPVSLGVTKAINPFIVLSSEMTVTFGRLLFEWGMSPRRLEGVAKQVNISLFKVIAKHCGTYIPAKPVKFQPNDIMVLLNTSKEVVLNAIAKDRQPNDDGQHPNNVAKELLEKCIEISKDIPENEDSYIGSKKFVAVTESDDFKLFQESTARIASVDLSRLENEDEKVCFMANLYNLMMLHGILLLMSGKLFSGVHDKFEERKWTFESFIRKPLGRLNVHRMFVYKVGLLDNLSALDLFQHILLGGRRTSYFGDGLSAPTNSFCWTKQLLRFAPEVCHPNIVFLLHQCTADSPKLKVIETSDVTNDVETVKEYLVGRLHLDVQSSKMRVPELIKLHRHLFLPRQPLFASSTETSLDRKEDSWQIVKFLKPLSSELQSNFDKIQRASLSVLYMDFNWSLNLPSKDQQQIPVQGYNDAGYNDSPSGASSQQKLTNLSEPVSVYLQEVFPLAGSLISVCINHRNLLAVTDELVNNQTYEEGFRSDEVSSLVNFVRQGLTNLHDVSNKYSVLQNQLKENSSFLLRLLKLMKKLTASEPAAGRVILNLVKICLQDICYTRPDLNRFNQLLCVLMEYFAHYGQSEVLLDMIGGKLKLLPSRLKDQFLYDAVRQLAQKVHFFQGDGKANSELYGKLRSTILQISDIYCLQQLVLDSIVLFPAYEALETLALVIEKCQYDEVVCFELRKKESEVLWCHEVSELLNCESSGKLGKNESSTTWQETQELVRTNPEEIASCLMSQSRFDLLAAWSEHFNMSQALEQECYQAKLLSVITESPLDIIKAHRVLERSDCQNLALTSIQTLLKMAVLSLQQSLFLTNYILNNLANNLSTDEIKQLLLLKLGTMSLQCLRPHMRKSYQNLVSRPLLVLEQLLMNMKVELAEKVTKIIRKEVEDNKHNGLLSDLSAECDDLFAKYASKSLEIPSLNTDMNMESGLKQNGQDISPKKFERKHSRQPSSTSKVNVKDLKNEDKATDSTVQSKVIPMKDRPSSQLPVKPLHRLEWMKDDAVLTCIICKIGHFSMFNRRHHCRHCGRVVCSNCSKHVCQVPGYNGNVRVCDQCYVQFYSKGYRPTEVKARETNAGSGSKGSIDSSIGQGSYGAAMLSEMDNPLQENESFAEWLLILDNKANEDTRAEFSYDQAPSASLCLSILDLYSNNRACGGLLLKFCNDLSFNIQPRDKWSQRLQEEVDATMIVGMIRYLSLNAKVKFLKSGYVKGVELCDTYLVYVEVLESLLANSWKEIPTMQELSQPEALRRLRDELVEDERFNLAIEITTKCGMDPNVVWFSHGMAQLKASDYEHARENFAKCMTLTKASTSKVFQQNIPYLEQILEVLESSPSFAPSKLFDLDAVLGQLDHGRQAFGTGFHKRRYDECIYYLSNYGSSGLLLDFYVRHNDLRKACLFVKDKNCDPDVFVEHLLLPCFQEGICEVLGREMADIDSTLQSWSVLLNGSCLILSRRGYYNCLYEVQLQMKDFFRAAKTCVRFFLGASGNPPKSYLDLAERLRYLEKAQNHIDTVLKDRLITRSSFVSHVGSSFLGGDQPTQGSSAQQEVSNGELKSYLNAIELQVLATKYFHERPKLCEPDQGKLPTLFGHGRERAELVVKLLLSSVDDSFSLASRIIQDFRLPVLGVYGRAAKKMIQLLEYEKSLALIKMMEDTGVLAEKEKDELLLSIVKTISQQEGQLKQANAFIRIIKNDVTKTEALIFCNRLRDALQKAIRKERVSQIQVILARAKESDQGHVVDLCERWLASYKEKEEMQQAVLRKSKSAGRTEERMRDKTGPSVKTSREKKK